MVVGAMEKNNAGKEYRKCWGGGRRPIVSWVTKEDLNGGDI